MGLTFWLRNLLFLSIILLNSCAVTKLLNSGTVHAKYTVVKAKFDGVNYENKERLGTVSFSVRNVQHPREFGKWNFNIRLTPSVHFDNITYQTGHPDPVRSGESMPDINVKRLIGMGNLKFSTHTPIGAFVLTGGFGGAVSKLDDGRGLNTIKTTEIRRLDLAYVGFFAKRFFFLAGPRYYKEQYESFVFAFRVGIFWGRVK